MAASSQRHPSHSSDSMEDSDGESSGFVAINGRDTPPSIVTSTGGSGLPKKNGVDEARSNRVTESSPSRQPPSNFQETALRAEGREQLRPVPHTNSNVDGPHKRKRLSLHDINGHSPSRYNYSPPRRQEQHQHMADRALRALGNSEYESPHTVRPNNEIDLRAGTDRWLEDRPMHDASSSRQDTADARLAEVLQNATHESSLSTRQWAPMEGPDDDEDRHDMYASDQPPNMSSHQSKRKRNFSNRTKTGCLTCRRRKKKCDEQHPICMKTFCLCRMR